MSNEPNPTPDEEPPEKNPIIGPSGPGKTPSGHTAPEGEGEYGTSGGEAGEVQPQ